MLQPAEGRRPSSEAFLPTRRISEPGSLDRRPSGGTGNMSSSNTPTSPTSPTGRDRSASGTSLGRRTSLAEGQRAILVAVDPSDNARVAFDCKYTNMNRLPYLHLKNILNIFVWC